MATIRETKDGVFVRDFLNPNHPQIVDLDTTIEALRQAPGDPHLVIHMHGGLVSTSNGRATALRLAGPPPAGIADPSYEQLSIVWGSGAFETVMTNFRELINDQLFDRVLKKVLQWASGRVLDLGSGTRSIGTGLPSPKIENDVDSARQDVDANTAPSPLAIPELAKSEIVAPGGVQDPDAEAELAELLESDNTLLDLSNAIDAELRKEEFASKRAGITATSRQAAEQTVKRLNDDFVQAYQAEVAGAGSQRRSSLGWVALKTIVKQAIKAGFAVVKRYMNGRQHDFYPTVFEEVARHFVAGKLASGIWAFMKQDTADHFKPGGAGTDLLQKLSALNASLDEGRRLRITLLGHSAGCIFAGEMLKAMKPSGAGLDLDPADVILLAPAVDFESFAKVLDMAENRINRLAMFTMDDTHEKEDRLLGAFYPRSLLYMISGTLEFDQIDDPILGMDRFHRVNQSGMKYTQAEQQALSRVRQFMNGAKAEMFWAVTPGSAPVTERSHATKHGDFDNDPETLKSIVARI